ncbi:unnamed protein product [Plutella xylostella]|uniref:(diamondback moth) hypothetical protein n=1 Tax=Plutella xylostella TaxID=51655 RepID=A0A8S4G7K3_PLUXY|nr:unnamed protein product [Plutella xylostella]
MDYLERCRFVHRDLAARNILLHTRWLKAWTTWSVAASCTETSPPGTYCCTPGERRCHMYTASVRCGCGRARWLKAWTNLERCRFVHRDLAARNILLHTR